MCAEHDRKRVIDKRILKLVRGFLTAGGCRERTSRIILVGLRRPYAECSWSSTGLAWSERRLYNTLPYLTAGAPAHCWARPFSC